MDRCRRTRWLWNQSADFAGDDVLAEEVLVEEVLAADVEAAVELLVPSDFAGVVLVVEAELELPRLSVR